MITAHLAAGDDFEAWRDAARPLALANVAPDEITWTVRGGEESTLPFDQAPPAPANGAQLSVPRAFVDLARIAIRHPDTDRFRLLYALLLKVSHDRAAIADRSDPLVARIEAMADEVNMKRKRASSNSATAWKVLHDEAMECTRCHLYKQATQTVFGEGPVDAGLMLVGEQPGDQEDLQGRPFVGPAGQLLDRALEKAGIDRTKTYITNAVKHFKFEARGKRRIHAKPDAEEISACRWWIDQERALVQPQVVVALGASAAHALLGKVVTISRTRDTPIPLEDGSMCHVTVHPSYLLRIPDEAHARDEYIRFVKDLARAKNAAGI